MFYYYDSTYILVLIGLVITMIASANVKNTFSKYQKVKSKRQKSGLDVANYILKTNNYNDISIKKTAGSLSDYYNPATKQVALSDSTMNDTSVAAIAVAAHECGHVIQYKEGYFPIKIKAWILPIVNFGSRMSIPLIFLGIIMSYNKTLIDLGILLFSFVLIFQIVTLPIEFDASRRALKVLDNSGILDSQEMVYATKVLKAAALTYVAAVLSTALQFLRLILIFGGRRRD
ncbi:MAG: zinc metallopeptidase [Tissierellia bacterium]|nr:zinc metallopeptidase [Tissierellia bacterium]